MELPPTPTLPAARMGKCVHRRSPAFPRPWEKSWEGLHRIAGVPPCGRGYKVMSGSHLGSWAAKGAGLFGILQGKHDPPLWWLLTITFWGALYTQVYGTQIRNAGEFMPV